MSSRWAVGVAVAALALAAAPVAITAVSASASPEAVRNLLKNGGAEAGPGSRDEDNVVVKIPGWTAAVDERGGQFNVLAYQSISPKDAQRGNFWPSTTASRLITGGKKLFVGGYMAPGRTHSILTQSVNVAGQRKAIDPGKLSATLAAALGGIGSSNDTMTVVAAFRDATGKRLSLTRIGPVVKAQYEKVFSDRGHATALLKRSGTKNVPKNTRTILVTLQCNKVDGSYCDAIADNVSLTLGTAG